MQWIQEVHLIHYNKLPDNMSLRKLDLHLILQMKNSIFVLNVGYLEAPLMVLPNEVKGLFIKI